MHLAKIRAASLIDSPPGINLASISVDAVMDGHAPLIELDLNMEVLPGLHVETLTGIPDPDAPPIFIAEECAS